MSRFELAIDKVLEHEGGFVNDPADPGGATNFGISLRYLLDQNIDVDGDGDVDKNDIRALTKDKATEIYRNKWWDKYRYFRLDSQPLATKVFDTSVNVGASQSHIFLQRSLNQLYGKNLGVDGILGDSTISAANALGTYTDPLLSILRQQQVNFYKLLIAQKPAFERYRQGWMRRANS